MNWPDLGDMVQGPRPGREGRLSMAVRIAAFEDVGRFKRCVDGIVRQVRESWRGVERVYPPGHLGAETEARYHRTGSP